MKKLIAVELNIPDSYLEKEDTFMEELLSQLAANNNTLVFQPHRKLPLITTRINTIFTRNYEFVDITI